MRDETSSSAVELERQLAERYGLMISQAQLAELLGRSASGLRYSLKHPSDSSTRALQACGRKVGRRIYYPAADVARIILGGGEA